MNHHLEKFSGTEADTANFPQINTIIDRFANCTEPKIVHRVVLEVPVDILSDRELDRYTATSAIYTAYPGAIVKQIRRLANG